MSALYPHLRRPGTGLGWRSSSASGGRVRPKPASTLANRVFVPPELTDGRRGFL